MGSIEKDKELDKQYSRPEVVGYSPRAKSSTANGTVLTGCVVHKV